MEDLMLRLELSALQDRYAAILDNDRIEEWPGMFTDECLYQIISRENEDLGFPAPVMHCENVRMLRDRVLALRHANVYEKPQYRHFVSGLQWNRELDGSISMQSSYLVINTSQSGVSAIYQAGRYSDQLVRTPDGLRFKRRRCIYDTSRVQTLLAFPI